MSKTKKIFVTLFCVILATIMLANNSMSYAASARKNLGTRYTLGLGDLVDRNDLYCVARGKHLYFEDELSYRIEAYVEIEGKKVIEGAYGVKESSAKKVTTGENEANAVIAAILGGALTQGHGNSRDNYVMGSGCNAAQKALWLYWNEWVDSVGNKYGFIRHEDNEDIANVSPDSVKYLQQAKAASKLTDYHIRMYLLNTGLEDKQQIVMVEPFDNVPTDEPEPGKTEVIGKVNLSGYVWEDIANSKNNEVNSKYEQTDLRVEGIQVHWRASDGSEIASTTTDKNGEYKFSTTLTLYNHPYGIKDKEKYDKINNSYVEFEYNGLKYTTVAYNGNLANSDTSKGKENETSRTNLDNKFDKVEKATVYDGNSPIISGLPNTKISDANYTQELAVSASTQNITRDLMKTAEGNKWIQTKTFCADHCQVGEGPHLINTITTSGGSTISIYCNGNVEIHDVDNEVIDPAILNGIGEIMGDAINSGNGGAHYYSAGEVNGPTHRDCLKSVEGIYEWNIQNVNLGLVKREQPDAAITSDIEKVRVIMKNQEYTYIYGNRGIQNNEELFDYKVKFGNKYTETYSRPINPADIAYVNYNNSDDLRVFVTYNIIVKNQSDTLKMGINSIVNYFDSNYTIYTGPGTSTSAGWQEASGNNNGYKIAYNTSLKDTKLQPGSKSEIIKIEFEVNQDRIKGLLDNDATLSNVSEIFSYTTYYGDNTICAEREPATVKGKVEQQYAGIDVDSTPGNAIPGNVDTYEDDTDKAPSFLLLKDPNYKTMSGIVYEDTQTAESKNATERLGNGLKETNEKGVENVKVELLNAETGETAYLYYKDASTSTGANRKPAITYTDANGNYSFGDGETNGVVVDKYIVKYTYGNADKGQDGNGTAIGETKINGNVINARNYKSTIITEDNVKNAMQKDNTETWHVFMDEGKDTSVAVDDLKDRLAIEQLKYSNYEKGVNISAYSKKVELQIEYTQQTTKKVDNNGGDFQSDLSVFDFGIMERAREDLVINKTISKIKLTLSNGQILLEGDPRKDKMNYVKAIGFNTNIDRNGREIAKFSKVDDKLLTIEIDSELLQGAKLEVWYSVTATNNSEIDYEYDKDYTDIIRDNGSDKLNFVTKDSQANYYYYGDKNGLNIINGSADLVVDYMAEKLVYDLDKEGNKDWFKFDSDGTTPIDRDYLKNNGYISDKTYEAIGDKKLQVIATKQFSDLKPAGDTKTSVMYTSTILSNQEDSSLFDNHVEIVGINGKTGRTIKEVGNDNREQVAKTYKPGNYIPRIGALHVSDNPLLEEDGLHQQDDDRVRIVVTPPTGIATYTIIYIIAAVIGAVVIAGAIVIIKKRL